MRAQAEKLRSIARELSKSKGSFELFALFLREDALGKWDLIVSSDWARQDKKAAIDLIVGKIRSVFTDEEMLMLSRLIVLEKDDAALKAINSATNVENSLVEIADSNFFGLAIKHAYLIASNRQANGK